MKFFNYLFLLIAAVFFLIGCKTLNNELHPLTHKLLSSGIVLNVQTSARQGFDTYAASPGAKAFAASVGKTGSLNAWGKG